MPIACLSTPPPYDPIMLVALDPLLALSNHPRNSTAWGGRGGGRWWGHSHARGKQPRAARACCAPPWGLRSPNWLEDPAIVEVMLNPDGRLWVDRLKEGLADTGERLSAADGERIVRLVAHHVGAEVHPASPRVSAELPDTGERFEGLIPPVVASPAFAIRKPAVAIFTLRDYAATGIMSAAQAELLRQRGCATPAMFSSPAAPRPARRPSSMRSSPRWRRPPIASC